MQCRLPRLSKVFIVHFLDCLKVQCTLFRLSKVCIVRFLDCLKGAVYAAQTF